MIAVVVYILIANNAIKLQKLLLVEAILAIIFAVNVMEITMHILWSDAKFAQLLVMAVKFIRLTHFLMQVLFCIMCSLL